MGVGDNRLDRDGEMTPDARLSAAEQAALAHLEAVAAADDPHLATRLKGAPASRSKARTLTSRTSALARTAWLRAVSAGWWGVPLVALGLLLMALGLGAGLAVSLVGTISCLFGLRMIAGLIERRLRSAP